MIGFFDTLIICFSIGGFILFLFLQVLVFRILKQSSVLKGIVSLFIVIGTIVLFLMFALYLYTMPLTLVLLLSIATGLLYSLLVFSYIIGIFGVVESSIRIRLLFLIVSAGEQGIGYKEILRKYNKEVILKKRLSRLIASGELKYVHGQYLVGKKITFFYIPAYIALFMKKFYGFNDKNEKSII